MRQVPDHARPLSGSRPPSLLASPLGKTSSYQSPAGVLRRTGTSNQKIGLIDPR